ncbi:HipA N-terminal domain-containing protein [bacterium]|nr:HipA N-terminal domain-containing protein [bacterium]MBU1917624.1 HipA N-terminal domain-containing protein [bacterium]
MFKPNKINVFSQTKSKRSFVGSLTKDDKKFYFQYDKKYIHQKSAIPLGPEFELWKDTFSSKTLFPSLADRIPSIQNPAYKDYCKQWGIDPKEKDPFVLLSTIGRRGPSTFIFEMAFENDDNATSIRSFRKMLELTQEEFELLFGLAHTTLIRLEQGRSTNETLLTYIQLIKNTPQALLWLLKTRGQYLHDNTVARLTKLANANLSSS